MARGMMYVETRPGSPEQAADYHKWYNEVHLPEIVEIEGFVSARRYEPVDHDDPFIAIYEIEADDIDEVRARVKTATSSGQTSTPVGIETDPWPTAHYFREITAYRP